MAESEPSIDVEALWTSLPGVIREFPVDLAAVVLIVLVTTALTVTSPPALGPIRSAFGLVFVLFVPGYAVLAAVFPERDSASPGERMRERGIGALERVTFSVGTSLALVSLVGIVLNATPLGIRARPVVLAVALLSLGATGVAAIRRWDCPPEARFRVPARAWLAAARDAVFDPDSRADAALTVALVAAVFLAAASVGYAAVVPADGERYSALSLLTEDAGGELVADDYPTEFERGEDADIVLGIDNHEHRTVEYTVVLLEQAVETEDAETRVVERRELDRMETTLDHGESWRHHQELEPTVVGEDVRLVWLLYVGEVPAEPSIETADHHAHLWVTVTDG